MLVSKLLKPQQIKLSLENKDKGVAIREVALLLKDHPLVVDFEGFYDDILKREKKDTTSLGHEVAFPHGRTDHVKGMLLSVGRIEEGILYEPDQTVKLLFVIGTPHRMATDYLMLLGGLARVLKNDKNRKKLLNAPTPEDFIKIIEEIESKIT